MLSSTIPWRSETRLSSLLSPLSSLLSPLSSLLSPLSSLLSVEYTRALSINHPTPMGPFLFLFIHFLEHQAVTDLG